MHLARPLWSIGLAFMLAVSTPLSAATTSSGAHASAPHISESHPSISKPSIAKPAPPGISKPEIARPPEAVITKPPLTSSSTPATISKPAMNKAPVVALTPETSADRTIAKGQSQQAYRQFQSDQERYRAPPAAAPTNATAARQSTIWRTYGDHWHSADAYYAARSSALEHSSPTVRMYYEHPPVYVLAGRPSYGGYAGAFLGGMLLDRIMQPSYAEWAYSHASDPGFQAWYADMQEQATTNAELRGKLAELDQQIAALKAQNAPISNGVPEGVDPALVIAPQTVMLATAQSTNWLLYFAIALTLVVAFLLACIYISRRNSR